MQVIFCQGKDQISLTTKETYYGITHVRKKISPLYVFEDKKCYKEFPYSTKTKNNLLTRFLEEHCFGVQPSHVDQRVATMLYR